ncbi:suppressor of fused domain protein [Aquimarina sp. I32.4]|uniref:suppressor of fused domain protein n=1 Tax=Aquimarina sp. I32.4 TaxID=2053903 RepID=UPI000CDEBE47|nr:suppressor of fused domain protein [Aquimarina sp. I32.4]
MEQVSQDNIKIAKFVAGAIGFEPNVYPYYDDDRKSSLDILDLVDPIDKSNKFYCTIGLSDYDNIIEFNDGNRNVPIEILIVGKQKDNKLPNILSTCGFYVSKNRWTVQPNTVFKNMIKMYYPSMETKHLMFTSPFLWEDKLTSLELKNKTVNWLLAIPITDKEFSYKEENGATALFDLFEEHDIDIFNINRISVV